MAGEGRFVAPLEEMVTLIVATDAFQDWVNVSTPTEAREHVYLYEENMPEAVDNRYAVVGDLMGFQATRRASGSGPFAFNIPRRGSRFSLYESMSLKWSRETSIDFRDFVSELLDELMTIQWTGSFKRIDDFVRVDTEGFEHVAFRWFEDDRFGYQMIFEEWMNQDIAT